VRSPTSDVRVGALEAVPSAGQLAERSTRTVSSNRGGNAGTATPDTSSSDGQGIAVRPLGPGWAQSTSCPHAPEKGRTRYRTSDPDALEPPAPPLSPFWTPKTGAFRPPNDPFLTPKWPLFDPLFGPKCGHGPSLFSSQMRNYVA